MVHFATLFKTKTLFHDVDSFHSHTELSFIFHYNKLYTLLKGCGPKRHHVLDTKHGLLLNNYYFEIVHPEISKTEDWKPNPFQQLIPVCLGVFLLSKTSVAHTPLLWGFCPPTKDISTCPFTLGSLSSQRHQRHIPICLGVFVLPKTSAAHTLLRGGLCPPTKDISCTYPFALGSLSSQRHQQHIPVCLGVFVLWKKSALPFPLPPFLNSSLLTKNILKYSGIKFYTILKAPLILISVDCPVSMFGHN